jgi:hypothetical protein
MWCSPQREAFQNIQIDQCTAQRQLAWTAANWEQVAAKENTSLARKFWQQNG